MQLADRLTLRRALATASCGLLGIAPAIAGADTSDPLQVDGALLHYQEKDRVSVDELSAIVTQTLGDDETVSVTPTVDSITGASPTGASITDKPQSYGADTAAANTLPLKHFWDRRYAVAVSWQQPLDRMTKSVLGAEASVEHDYNSIGAEASVARDYNSKLTTLSAGLSADFDTVVPTGGIVPKGLTPLGLSPSTASATPAALALNNKLGGAAPRVHAFTTASGVVIGGGSSGSSQIGGSDNPYPLQSRGKQVIDGNIGLIQVVNRRTLMQFNYGLGLSSGYLTDPYKIISMVDGTSGETVGYVSEQRPDTRLRQTLYWETVLHLPEDVIHLSYRYFWDDWGIRSHTADLNYHLDLSHGCYLEPQARYYTQTAADFYHTSLVSGAALPAFASADYRLAEMSSFTYGLKIAMPLNAGGELSLRASYMQQIGNSHPADAIGIQRNENLYPGLEAIMVQLGLTLKF
jgi:hypothetical protein